MNQFRAAIFGCGGIARAHASGYRLAGIPIAAAADIVEESACGLAEAFDVPKYYTDYRQLLEEVKPEIVSICTWPPVHEEMVLTAVEAGVRAIACEKPISTSLGSADRMTRACQEAGTLLIIGHQRRYQEYWMTARQLVANGAVGTVERVLIKEAGDLLSDGVHGLDLALFLLADPLPQWVLGQIDRSQPSPPEAAKGGRMEAGGFRYGHAVEHSAIATIGVSSGQNITLEMGRIKRGTGYIELIVLGSEGQVRVNTEGELHLVNRNGLEIKKIDREEVSPVFALVMRDIVRYLEGELTLHPLEVSFHRKALEAVMAVFESARRRRIVPLPLEIKESPLEAMVAAGEI